MKLKKAGIILYSNDLNKILLVKGPTGKWSFPKGHYEEDLDNHSMEKCAIRECEEETSLERCKYKILRNVSDFVYSDCIFFNAILNPGAEKHVKIKDPNEILNIRWFTIEEVGKLKKANRYLREWIIQKIVN